MDFFMIDAGQLAALKKAATRLHSEERMGGDEMRDLGHVLESVVRVCKELPIPDDVPTPRVLDPYEADAEENQG